MRIGAPLKWVDDVRKETQAGELHLPDVGIGLWVPANSVPDVFTS